ncbi:GlcNAc-PI de-N-acetylase [Marinomonas polaris DSM 16579]|uniref:GlcNAc-PI de-N-acetylase n=1 Tax=Marinomonas polaris DSM 16579 TaxID=1122206 RepID=A0A1M5FR75_9GAMM|nr:PIG-L family deacetylase [Marinomonas polaris]SHF94077.1 GlcNAc-PI de-N-acetylase [Marinomonas polaris DSM 16579]
MKKIDYQYALQPDWQSDVLLKKQNTSNISNLTLADEAGFAALKHDEFTWLLSFPYQSTHKKKQGCISAFFNNGEQNTIDHSQFFEANQEGTRHLNLSGLLSKDKTLHQLQLAFEHCKAPTEAKLLGFKKPNLADGPILIIAPHADDAELAAYGLYSDFADQVWITTINAGQNLQSLDRQYISGLDETIGDATQRKAQIRAWNSMTTPLLAGVKFDRLSSLGYFNLTKESLYQTPKESQSDKAFPALTPQISRTFNTLKLPNDEQNISSGQLLIEDLTSLLEQIKPSTVLVTEPEIDPHPEHIMSAYALALAINKSSHVPNRVLMYVNHLRKIKKFPYGPEHSKTALAPWYDTKSIFGHYSCYSHQLDVKTQKDKVVSFDSMHDLRSKPRIQKMLKKWWHNKVLKSHYKYYGYHNYFLTHIKANEVFTFVDGQIFSQSLIHSIEQDKKH